MGLSFLNKWHELPLARQFVLVAVAVLLPGMALTGWWISTNVRDAVVKNTAAATAISMDGLISPLVAEISGKGELSEGSRNRLDGLLTQVRADRRIVSMKIWKSDGTIIYSSFRQMVGKSFPLSDNFASALSGSIGADFDNEPHVEDANERASGVSLLEVYAPVRDPVSRQIIAVSEFYANGDQLSRDVAKATLESWLVVCAVTAAMLGLLSMVAVKGGRTIAGQRLQLHQQVTELKDLLGQNEVLRERLRQANEDVSSTNESVLRHVGADLHDGPAQKLSYAAMRLSSLRKLVEKGGPEAETFDGIGQILSETLADVRRMSNGLMLPELQNANLVEAVELAIRAHEDVTGSKVARILIEEFQSGSLALRTCLYRLVQEGLTNAFKHAGGKQQAVTMKAKGSLLIEISDAGPGISHTDKSDIKGLGLRGMRARVEALGGVLTVGNKDEGGTVVRAEFPLA